MSVRPIICTPRGKRLRQHLDRHLTPEFGVTGAVDGTHTAFAQLSGDPEVGQRLADQGVEILLRAAKRKQSREQFVRVPPEHGPTDALGHLAPGGPITGISQRLEEGAVVDDLVPGLVRRALVISTPGMENHQRVLAGLVGVYEAARDRYAPGFVAGGDG